MNCKKRKEKDRINSENDIINLKLKIKLIVNNQNNKI